MSIAIILIITLIAVFAMYAFADWLDEKISDSEGEPMLDDNDKKIEDK